ncbi:MAG: fused DSP-PTPase phosphatase/NAD kinase-like protein [Bdellovibrionales bacterium]
MKHLIATILLVFGTAAYANSEIPNFITLSTEIYRGGRPTADGMIALKNLGVKTDLNLQGGDVQWDDPATASFMAWWEPGETPENIAKEKTIAEELQMNFVSIPLNAIATVSAQADADIDRALEILNDPSAQPVFIHCEHGKDRTGLVIALYRVKYQGYSVAAAHDEWRDSGHKGVGAYMTGNLDTYFYEKAAKLLNVASF